MKQIVKVLQQKTVTLVLKCFNLKYFAKFDPSRFSPLFLIE